MKKVAFLIIALKKAKHLETNC